MQLQVSVDIISGESADIRGTVIIRTCWLLVGAAGFADKRRLVADRFPVSKQVTSTPFDMVQNRYHTNPCTPMQSAALPNIVLR